jgi:hypothetical protein
MALILVVATIHLRLLYTHRSPISAGNSHAPLIIDAFNASFRIPLICGAIEEQLRSSHIDFTLCLPNDKFHLFTVKNILNPMVFEKFLYENGKDAVFVEVIILLVNSTDVSFTLSINTCLSMTTGCL